MPLDQSITTRVLTPQAMQIVQGISDYYKSQGKVAASENYKTQVKKFFQWCEANGYDVGNLPSNSVENYLNEAGFKITTTYLMRAQLKSALREASEQFGSNFYHLEFEIGVPKEIKDTLKENKKAKEAAAKAKAKGGKKLVPVPQKFLSTSDLSTRIDAPQEVHMANDTTPEATQSSAPTTTHTSQGSTTTVPGSNGSSNVVVQVLPPGVGTNGRPVAPAGQRGGQQAVAGAPIIATPKTITINTVTFNGPHVKINRVADGTDPLVPPGTETFVTQYPTAHIAAHGDVAAFLQNYVVKHMKLPPSVGQVQFVLYELNDRRQPTGRRDELVVSVPLSTDPYVQGPMMQNSQQMYGGSPQQPVVVQLEQQAAPQATSVMSPSSLRAEERLDKTTEFLLRKLENDAVESQRRAAELEKKLLETRDAQTNFLLMQQMRQEQELRAKLEEQKQDAMKKIDTEKEEERRRQERDEFRRMMEMQAQSQRPAYQEPPPWMMQPPPPPPPLPEVPRVDASAEMAKAFAESQAKMMEAMMGGLAAARNVPLPPPPPPQKDAAEWMVPMMTNMAQMQQQQAQMQAQMAQQQQQMMMQMQAENMKMVVQMQQAQAISAQQANERMLQFMMASNSKESPEVAVLREQLRQSQQQISALSQRGDEIETLADQVQKIQAVSEILGNGGGGKGGGLTTLISELIQNADTIGKGVAAAMQGINAQKAAASMAQAPVAQAMIQAPVPMSPPSSQLSLGSTAQSPADPSSLPQATGNGTPEGGAAHIDPPPEALAALNAATELGTNDDVEAVENRVQFFVEFLKSLNTANHPVFQKQLERLLKAFSQADDEDDLYTLTKHLWIVVGEKPNKPIARLMAEAIAKYYAMIHKSLFGKARALGAPHVVGRGAPGNVPEPTASEQSDNTAQAADQGAESDDSDSEEEGDDQGDEEEEDADFE